MSRCMLYCMNGLAGGLKGRNAAVQLRDNNQVLSFNLIINQSGSQIGGLQCISLPVTDDDIFENDVTYTVSLSTSESNMVTATGSTTVTITDDDRVSFLVLQTIVYV